MTVAHHKLATSQHWLYLVVDRCILGFLPLESAVVMVSGVLFGEHGRMHIQLILLQQVKGPEDRARDSEEDGPHLPHGVIVAAVNVIASLVDCLFQSVYL